MHDADPPPLHSFLSGGEREGGRERDEEAGQAIMRFRSFIRLGGLNRFSRRRRGKERRK